MGRSLTPSAGLDKLLFQHGFRKGRQPISFHRQALDKGRQLFEKNDRMGALRAWEDGLRSSATSAEEKGVMAYNAACVHAYFGDVEPAQVAMRGACVVRALPPRGGGIAGSGRCPPVWASCQPHVGPCSSHGDRGCLTGMRTPPFAEAVGQGLDLLAALEARDTRLVQLQASPQVQRQLEKFILATLEGKRKEAAATSAPKFGRASGEAGVKSGGGW